MRQRLDACLPTLPYYPSQCPDSSPPTNPSSRPSKHPLYPSHRSSNQPSYPSRPSSQPSHPSHRPSPDPWAVSVTIAFSLSARFCSHNVYPTHACPSLQLATPDRYAQRWYCDAWDPGLLSPLTISLSLTHQVGPRPRRRPSRAGEHDLRRQGRAPPRAPLHERARLRLPPEEAPAPRVGP